MPVVIRPEASVDIEQIDAVVEAAFGSHLESKLVRALRDSSAFIPELSLVAEENDTVVGHVMITCATLKSDDGERPILLLAPLAVRPDRQRDGIGGELMRASLAIADERREPVVVLLGHPAYYPRFGFEPAAKYGFLPPYPGEPTDAFMVKRLSAYDPSYRGRVVYSQAFDVLDEA